MIDGYSVRLFTNYLPEKDTYRTEDFELANSVPVLSRNGFTFKFDDYGDDDRVTVHGIVILDPNDEVIHASRIDQPIIVGHNDQYEIKVNYKNEEHHI